MGLFETLLVVIQLLDHALLVVLEHHAFLLKLLFDGNDFFLFTGKLSTYLDDLLP